MGDWSDYFEDFPEENPANYINGRFDPQGASNYRAAKFKQECEQAALDAEIKAIIQKHSKPSSSKKG